jgi:hypothetical protein
VIKKSILEKNTILFALLIIQIHLHLHLHILKERYAFISPPLRPLETEWPGTQPSDYF